MLYLKTGKFCTYDQYNGKKNKPKYNCRHPRYNKNTHAYTNIVFKGWFGKFYNLHSINVPAFLQSFKVHIAKLFNSIQIFKYQKMCHVNSEGKKLYFSSLRAGPDVYWARALLRNNVNSPSDPWHKRVFWCFFAPQKSI